jgi:hypothetical protein
MQNRIKEIIENQAKLKNYWKRPYTLRTWDLIN